MTEKLYYQNGSLLEFDAAVLESSIRDGRGEIVLDRTCFYPGGGGQPCDLGTLDGARVVGMREEGERIVHVVELERTGAAPAAGAAVHGAVDAARRRDFMQQHTGEHVFAQALKRAAGLETVSVHFSDEETTIELAVDGVDEPTIRQAEQIANAAIRENRKVVTHEVDPAEASRFPLRRIPPAEGRLRIVEVEGYDWVACCGVHAASTGELQLIMAGAQERMRGHARIHLKIGQRALDDYGRKTTLSQALGRALTCGEPLIERRVQDLLDGQREAARELKRLQAAAAVSDADAATARDVGGASFVKRLFTNAGGEYLKAFVERVISSPGRVCIAIDRGTDGFQWLVAHSLAGGLELSGLLRETLPIADAKGGGRGARMQGAGRNNEAAERFADAVEERIADALGKGGTP